MSLLSAELLISKLSYQVDGNVDIDCCLFLDPADEEGMPMGEGAEVSLSASLTDALDGIFELSESGDYTEEELKNSHLCLSTVYGKIGNLMKVIEARISNGSEEDLNG